MATHRTLLPGTVFPALSLAKVGGGSLDLKPAEGRHLLVVAYRGFFCPLCQGTLQDVQGKLDKLQDAGIDVVAISAEPLDVAEKTAADWGVTFPVGAGLKGKRRPAAGEGAQADLRTLGLYVSDPRHYQPIDWRFGEPGWFLVSPDGKIQYVDVASTPVGGRVNVDHLLFATKWVQQRLVEHPEFAGYVWGGVPAAEGGEA